jgi:hypothetical protein
MYKTVLKMTAISAAFTIMLSGCTANEAPELENKVTIIGESQVTATEEPAGEPTGDNVPPSALKPTKPSDYDYPELPIGDAFAMLGELGNNTVHSTTTLGSLEKYIDEDSSGVPFNVTIGFDPTLVGNSLAVSFDYPDDSGKEDSIFAINDISEEENRNIAKWLLGHQIVLLSQLTGSIIPEVKDEYIEVVWTNGAYVDRYYYQDKVITKRERIDQGSGIKTIRTIEYGTEGEAAILLNAVN